MGDARHADADPKVYKRDIQLRCTETPGARTRRARSPRSSRSTTCTAVAQVTRFPRDIILFNRENNARLGRCITAWFDAAAGISPGVYTAVYATGYPESSRTREPPSARLLPVAAIFSPGVFFSSHFFLSLPYMNDELELPSWPGILDSRTVIHMISTQNNYLFD